MKNALFNYAAHLLADNRIRDASLMFSDIGISREDIVALVHNNLTLAQLKDKYHKLIYSGSLGNDNDEVP